MTVSGVLLLVLSAAVVVVTVFLVRMMHQLVRTASELEKLTRSLNNEVVPHVERVLDQTESTLAQIRALSLSAQKISMGIDQITETVGGVVLRAQDAVAPAIEAISTVSEYLRRTLAVVAGFKAGLGALRRHRLREPEEAEWGI